MALGWLILSVGWCLQGMSLWAVLRAMDARPAARLSSCRCTPRPWRLGSWRVSFRRFPADYWCVGGRRIAGTGLRTERALVSAVIFRLVLLVSELVVSIILYAVGWRRLRKAPAAARVDYRAAPQR
jgi:hypothetical protein